MIYNILRQTSSYRIKDLQGEIRKALSIFRNPAYALISPYAVVLDCEGLAKPRVQQLASAHGSVEEQFLAAASELLQLADDLGAHGRCVNIVVSDFWARPLVIPFPGRVPTDADVEAVLTSSYRRIYADMMQGWSWSWALQEARLVSVAWPSDGLTELRNGINNRAGLLRTAKPMAVEITGSVLRQPESVWFAIIEHFNLTLLRLNKGAWDGYLVVNSQADIAKTLVLQLTRETARLQDSCKKVSILDFCCTANLSAATRTLKEQGWSVHNCSSKEAGSSRAYRLMQSVAWRGVQ